ncbi:MAG: hypothetical protein QOI74_831 [Micromonosporaceae bacterium]|nr:hypothetical protein [Micromonosporaceae bacterium]
MRSSVEPPERVASEPWYRILGPLEVLAADRPLNLGGVRARRVVAALLLGANRPVSLSQLVAAVWEGTPPTTARRQVQNAVAALRAVLARAGAGNVITTHGSGYVLRVGPDRLDSLVFERSVDRARAMAVADRPAAVAVLREALALWRGPVLAGLGGQLYDLAATRLEEMRLAALDDVIEWELAMGGHARLVSELRALVAEHPLREGFTCHLMVALYRGGRQAEALAAYHELARGLATELGTDPGPTLRRRYEMVLREDPELIAPDPVAGGPGRSATRSPADQHAHPPAQLPPDPVAFTGHQADLDRLDQLISGVGPAATVVVSAIGGTVGVGKTALAVHWAHRARDAFPDGQLYVNLRGYSAGPPVYPIDALSRFLRVLGVPAARVPTDRDEAAAMYRSLLADRRVLVVADNARSPEQVRPLLPGNRECLVVVTSRDPLGGLVALDGARRLIIDVLGERDAVELLGRLIGHQRVAAEAAAAARLARDCGYLPLALTIAAGALGDRAEPRLGSYATRLATGVAAGQDPVRAGFELSYASLSEPARRTFAACGLAGAVDGADGVTPERVAAFAGVTEADAGGLLATLAARRLITEYAPGRFGLHDLLGRYAADLAGTD